MSLFDRAARRAPARARQTMLLADAARRLGPAWIGFRLRYSIERRLGLIERRSPLGSWPPIEPCADGVPGIVAAPTLAAWLKTNADMRRQNEWKQIVDDLAHRRFVVFGERVELEDWHHDPLSGVRYRRDVHWSRVDEFPDVDIKRVWEPSRFGWAFDLARAHLVLPESGASDLFWELLAEWCDQNLPNHGVNWACGQESSFRLMAVVASASAMRADATEAHAELLQRLAWVTAERVEANIGYARSQRNNHHASEAVGLLTASLLFPNNFKAAVWRASGEHHLREVCEELIFADGGSSQYSTNYHRVFVHNLVWAEQCYRTANVAVPAWLSGARRRAGRFLAALVEPLSGSGPFFGSDDGARILPLSEHPHRYLAADAALASADRPAPANQLPYWESNAWFGLDDTARPEQPPRASDPWFETYPDMGVHVIGAADTRVFIIGRNYRFRPNQDDNLQCDIWMDGVNCVFDVGTQSYHPAPGEPGLLDLGSDHNGPRQVGEALMRKAGRFIWARWPTTVVSMFTEGPGVVASLEATATSGVTLERVVRAGRENVTITDRCSAPFEVSWAVTECDFDVVGADEREVVPAYRSSGYGHAAEIDRQRFVSTGPMFATVSRACGTSAGTA